MPDGTRLAARIWLPDDPASSGGGREAGGGTSSSGGGREAGGGTSSSGGGREAGGGTSRVPAILDFLPYRQGDLMAAGDAALYPHLAAAGSACARVDLRGPGTF